MTVVLMVALIGGFIAYVNGANDVSKGIATLAGSGLSDYRRAIYWGTAWTTVGSLVAVAFAGAMVTTFGKGLLEAGVLPTLPAAIATIVGAGVWVGLATRFGLPVSTTHAIVGSVAGVATVAYGIAGVNWSVMGGKIALPLLLSPVMSLAITAVVLDGWKRVSPSTQSDCLCAEVTRVPAILVATTAGPGMDLVTAPEVTLVAGSEAACAKDHPNAARLTLNHLHWLTSASTSFARGLNDAPKMVALVLGASMLTGRALTSSGPAYLLIALGMLAGSWMAGRRVTTVLAEGVTPMNHREGFVANLVTAALVGPAASFGLPMSTTHVSSGAIIAVGLQQNGSVNWRTVRDMLLAWIFTLPAAVLLGVAAYEILRAVHV